MESNLKASFDRANELMAELETEARKGLAERSVSTRAVQLTHEIIERLRSILDRVARRSWELHVAPQLPKEDQARAVIYFPIAGEQQGYDSTMRRWLWKAVRHQHLDIDTYLLSQQPFTDLKKNRWLATLSELAAKGKHIDLVPQIRFAEKITTVSRGGNSISFSGGVTFSGGISIMGAPIDPRTQRVVPTIGVSDKVEIWVGYQIAGYGVNALGFCKSAIESTRAIVEEMTDKFGLG